MNPVHENCSSQNLFSKKKLLKKEIKIKSNQIKLDKIFEKNDIFCDKNILNA